MRDRFSELIQAGVATFNPKPTSGDVPSLDPIVKTYNNVWGLLTDTHMSKVDDGYIITGTFVKSPHWERFTYIYYWGSTCFKLASGFNSLCDMLSANGLCWKQDIYNSDYVVKVYPKPDTSTDPAGCGECPCSVDCPVCGTVGESRIPHSLGEIFGLNAAVIREKWNNAESSSKKLVESLNDAFECDNFKISTDGQYLLFEGDKLIKIPLNASKK